MRTLLDPITNTADDLEVSRSDFVGNFHPREIVADPELMVARKRAMLSRWLSDANAIAGAPHIRRCPAGVTVSVDHLRRSLDKLDEMVEAIALAETQASGAAA